MRLLLLTLLLFQHACVAPRESAPTGPAVRPTDSIRLQETDASPFGRTVGFSVRSGDGRIFTADPSRRSIQVHARDGSFLTSFGRRGSGPGEFQGIGRPGLLDDDATLAVADANRGVLVVLEADSGRLIRELPWPGGAIATGAWVEAGPRVLVPVSGQPSPFVLWDRRSDSVYAFSETPAEWAGSISRSMAAGLAGAVPDGEAGWWAQLQLVQGVVRLDAFGNRLGVLPVPAVLRRGEPVGAAAAAIAEARAGRPPSPDPIASLTLGVGRRPDGLLVLVHVDPILGRGSDGIEAMSQRYFVSFLRVEDGAACVDGTIPIAPDDIAPPIFAGDSIYFVTQHTTAAGEVERWVRGFVVDPAACTWIKGDSPGGH